MAKGSISRKVQRVADLMGSGKTVEEIASDLQIDLNEARNLVQAETRRVVDQQMKAASVMPSGRSYDPVYVAGLEAEVAKLRQQLVWAQRGNPSSRSGGTLTLFRTDDHNGDRAHLLSCQSAMEAKFLTVVEQYSPDKITILLGGDWVAGRGIYKEQQMDSVTSHVDEQVQIGAVALYDFIESVFKAWRKSPAGRDPLLEVKFHRGNHDYANGHEIVSYLHLLMQAMCKDWTAVRWVNEGIRSIQNLSDGGTYNVLVTHGTGHSQISPSSPAFWNDVKDTLIDIMAQLEPKDAIRRVLHGHTHFFNVGMERIPGFFVDTGGGCQRNERVKLNLNKRPMGWICYISPRGYDSILEPMGIQPDIDLIRREMNDPHLAYRNIRDAADKLQRFAGIGPSMGDMTSLVDLGVMGKEGRW